MIPNIICNVSHTYLMLKRKHIYYFIKTNINDFHYKHAYTQYTLHILYFHPISPTFPKVFPFSLQIFLSFISPYSFFILIWLISFIFFYFQYFFHRNNILNSTYTSRLKGSTRPCMPPPGSSPFSQRVFHLVSRHESWTSF